jgi:hydroxymethylglutaryl-CoA lyase
MPMIRMVEVGPRDGLQNEKGTIPTALKVAFVNALSEAGLGEIEVSAFVSPEWVPQLADAHEVFTQMTRKAGVVYSALVPNERGLDRALAAKVDRIAVLTAASNTFNRKNVNTDIDGTFARMTPVVRRAKGLGLPVRGYISTAFWCPYEGQIAPDKVLEVARRLMDLGVDEISIGDTIGKATASEVQALLNSMSPHVPVARLALHFHDTYGRAVGNVLTAWRAGVTAFDASVGGLGGCPYAPGAPGNVSTEAVVAALEGAGADVGVDREALRRARDLIAGSVARPLAPLNST